LKRAVWSWKSSVSRSSFSLCSARSRSSGASSVEAVDLAVDLGDLARERLLPLLGPGELRLHAREPRVDRLLAAGDVPARRCREERDEDCQEGKQSENPHRR
jgi:hypothetical protein